MIGFLRLKSRDFAYHHMYAPLKFHHKVKFSLLDLIHIASDLYKIH